MAGTLSSPRTTAAPGSGSTCRTLGRPVFNVATVPAMPVIVEDGHVQLVMMAWGLLPHRAKNLHGYHRPINARADTRTEKPIFRGLLKQNRCLIPTSGFYESPLLAFAGLYEVWHDADGGAYPTSTIITREANDLVSLIHHRMQVILRPEDEARWLGPHTAGTGRGEGDPRAVSPEAMDAYPVSPHVNSPTEDDEQLITPLS